jgi:hypothetical protein
LRRRVARPQTDSEDHCRGSTNTANQPSRVQSSALQPEPKRVPYIDYITQDSMPDEMDEHGAEVSDGMSENEDESETFARDEDDKMTDHNNGNGNGEPKKKYDPKDPSRPRRKKARRACYACQRAHLTCGK